MSKTATDTLVQKYQMIDVRRTRAAPLAAAIMRAIEDDVPRSSQAKAHHAILDCLMAEGIEIISDNLRAELGLPARGPEGWTAWELYALETKRLQMLLEPIPLRVPSTD